MYIKDKAMTNQKPSTDNKTQELIGVRTMPPPEGASDVLRDAIGSNSDLVLERLKQLGNVPQNDAEWLALVAADTEAKVRGTGCYRPVCGLC